ncbi:hypothetical protein [Hugenholtzia roseola]|uniref:hypothetical protein n=1 Tax=Hugenholtzia roseola TaxID=1002 RepID=UPI001376E25D|nr:hypothetical protein [Hugenholtzia roseola]
MYINYLEKKDKINNKALLFFERAKKSNRVYSGFLDKEGQKYILIHVVSRKQFRRNSQTGNMFPSATPIPRKKRERIEFIIIKI